MGVLQRSEKEITNYHLASIVDQLFLRSLNFHLVNNILRNVEIKHVSSLMFDSNLEYTYSSWWFMDPWRNSKDVASTTFHFSQICNLRYCIFWRRILKLIRQTFPRVFCVTVLIYMFQYSPYRTPFTLVNRHIGHVLPSN